MPDSPASVPLFRETQRLLSGPLRIPLSPVVPACTALLIWNLIQGGADTLVPECRTPRFEPVYAWLRHGWNPHPPCIFALKRVEFASVFYALVRRQG